MLTYGDDVAVSDLQQLEVRVDTGAQAGEIGVFDDTVVLVVTQGEERVAALGTVAQREVVLLDDTGAGGLAEPVRVAGRGDTGGVQVLGHSHLVQDGIAAGVIAPVVLVAQGVHIGIQAVVHIALPHHLAEFLGIEDLHTVHVGLGGHGGVKVNLYLAVLAGLGGDDDDAVGGAATVDGSGSSVLEHLDGLDVVTVELVHTGLGGHTVNDVQGIIVVEGADTTDTDCCST